MAVVGALFLAAVDWDLVAAHVQRYMVAESMTSALATSLARG